MKRNEMSAKTKWKLKQNEKYPKPHMAKRRALMEYIQEKYPQMWILLDKLNMWLHADWPDAKSVVETVAYSLRYKWFSQEERHDILRKNNGKG